jgi:hypothetical protein
MAKAQLGKSGLAGKLGDAIKKRQWPGDNSRQGFYPELRALWEALNLIPGIWVGQAWLSLEDERPHIHFETSSLTALNRVALVPKQSLPNWEVVVFATANEGGKVSFLLRGHDVVECNYLAHCYAEWAANGFK